MKRSKNYKVIDGVARVRPPRDPKKVRAVWRGPDRPQMQQMENFPLETLRSGDEGWLQTEGGPLFNTPRRLPGGGRMTGIFYPDNSRLAWAVGDEWMNHIELLPKP